ncbi:ATP-binding protein [Candidatus Daviesbacteria bacterium]|nr:ATP-binding protein [Candidatus Daviesbacteria bacterium]
MIPRIYEDLGHYISPGRVIVIYGPRRVGKTVLLTGFLNRSGLKYKLDNGDDISVQEVFNSQSINRIRRFTEGYELIAIDEAQNIENIGLGLKILVDNVPDIKVIATGSASFELANKVGEPLTGRQTTLKLYPIAQLELLSQYNKYELSQKLEEYLIYGSYPEVLNIDTLKGKADYLRELVNSYLLKDILTLEQVKGSKILLDLLRLIAFQVGSEVSLNELSRNLGIDVKTVRRYLDLLEKAFVLINLRGFSRNLRSEIKEKSKYYFYDTGIRNAVISNFNPINLRDDIGKLWENFLIIERIKKQQYQKLYANNYFWRTWEQKEVDFVEEREGQLFGYEFKYSAAKDRLPRDFLNTYPGSDLSVVNTENYLDFVS